MTNNIDKIVYVNLLDKQGKAHHNYYYLLSEFEEGQKRIETIGDVLVRLVPIDTPAIKPLLTASIDDEVTMGSFVGYVEDITTEEELIESQAEHYANIGIDIINTQIDSGPRISYSKSR